MKGSALASEGALNPSYYLGKIDSLSFRTSTTSFLTLLSARRFFDRILMDIMMAAAGIDPELATVIQSGVDMHRFSTTSKVRLIEASSPDLLCLSTRSSA
jgi:CheY-like chemotaxis protein